MAALKKFFRRKNIANKSHKRDTNFKFRTIDKDDASRAVINAALNKHFLFEHMNEDTKLKLVNSMAKVKIMKGHKIIKQGKKGDDFYVLQSGTADVIVDKAKVSSMEAPTAFGELALMYSCPRAATIMATSSCVLWKVDRKTFQMTLSHTSVANNVIRCNFLRKVPLLKKLSNHEITTIGEAMQEENYKAGDKIINEGDTDGDKFYVIVKGVVEVFKGDTKIRELKTGNFFGEHALQKAEPRNASCVAANDVTCLTLDKISFEQMLGPLQTLLEKVDIRRENELKAKVAAAKLTSPAAPALPKLPKLIQSSLAAEIQVIRTIGTGTFGRVKLVQHKLSKKVLAMKCLQKDQIVASHQEKNIMYEKNSMAEMKHPFILKLEGTHQDADSLYMFLEIVQGGELWSLLYQKGVLARGPLGGIRENDARMYAACVASAFKHIHETGYAYRDLKPENLLVDADGYIKIADFGFAKKLQRNTQTTTLCGTPEYLAPELVLSKGHNRAVDYWAFGVLVYELVVGVTPFYDQEQSRIFVRIVHSKRTLKFPEGFPPAAADFVGQLLNPNAVLRLGMLLGGADDILNHRWFKGVDWKKLESKTYKSPWKPTVKHPLDDSAFDAYDEDDDVAKFTGDQAAFKDF